MILTTGSKQHLARCPMDAQISVKDVSFVGSIGAVNEDRDRRLASLFSETTRLGRSISTRGWRINDRTYGERNPSRQHLERL